MQPDSWHSVDVSDVELSLGTDKDAGLTDTEASNRLSRYGYNRLQESESTSVLAIFLSQFSDFMVLVLVGAAAISLLLGEVIDTLVILAIVVVNAILGFVQEMKAERSLEALKILAAPKAVVIRDGHMVQVDADTVVPGDVLVLESGTKVAADVRLTLGSGLQAEESSLTGESVPVTKSADKVAQSASISEQASMVFAGTTIVRGRGQGIVVATAMQTQFGKIAGLLAEPKTDKTPLQRRLEVLGKQLVALSVFVVGLVVVAGIWRGETLFNMFLAGVSLAVAAVPEGLPAVVTISLALGVQRMVRRNSIVRKLPAVEALGCATVVCSDKTGTITVNQMTVREMWAGDVVWKVSGSGYEPVGEFTVDGQEMKMPALQRALIAGCLCNNAGLDNEGGEGGWGITGDPTEGALLVASAKHGLWRDDLEGKHPRHEEIPFESDRRRMSVIVGDGNNRLVLTKGAPDTVVDLCTEYIDEQGQLSVLTDDKRREIGRQAQSMADRAMRVLALAGKSVSGSDRAESELERDLVLYGLAGMIDPPRPEVKSAVEKCRSAGIRVLMITGDHEATAAAVAREVGISSRGDRVVAGRELENLTSDKLQAISSQANVFARVSPHHKLKLVRGLRGSGHIVAMTGDGVNDAPAVREADIGVSMGITGTDVTRETSDIILTDDNFATIVAAIEEGRSIYENIRRFIRYLLSCNVGEIVVMFLASLVGLPLPLLPAQILLLNLVTDGLPATALGIERTDPQTMNRSPRNPRENIFAGGMAKMILARGLLIGMVSLIAFWLGLVHTQDLSGARTMAFSTLVVSQLLFAFMVRTGAGGRIVGNPYLLLAVLSSAAVLIAVMYVPVLQTAFRTTGLDGVDWMIVMVAAIIGAVGSSRPQRVTGKGRR